MREEPILCAFTSEYAGKYASTSTSNWVTNPFRFPLTLGDKGINEALRNPYWILQNAPGENKNYAQCTQIDLNVSPTYQVTNTFSISDRFNFLMTRNSEKYFLPVRVPMPGNSRLPTIAPVFAPALAAT